MKKALKISVQLLPLAFLIIIFIVFKSQKVTFTYDTITSYLTESIYINILIALGFYALKSILIVVPLMAVNVACGIVFGFWGIAVEILGATISLSIGYTVGRISGKPLSDKLLSKSEKLRKIVNINRTNEFVLCFCITLIGLVSFDAVNIILGSTKVKYKNFIFGSICGLLPNMLIDCFLGVSISLHSTTAFTVALVLKILVKLAGLLFYFKYIKKNLIT